MNALERPYDVGHLSFLQLVKVIARIGGAEFAKTVLVKTGAGSADYFEHESYGSWEAFIRALDSADGAVPRFEGAAQYYGHGVFGLPTCPFAASIGTYTDVMGRLPRDFASVTEELNKDSPITSDLHIGDGAAVSPLCGVHQSIRSALGNKITIAGKKVAVHQLGCKSESGDKRISDKQCEAALVPRSEVAEILEDNMCCYKIVLKD